MIAGGDNPFARFVGPAAAHGAAIIAAGAEPEVALGAMLALWAPQHGHSCVDLSTAGDDLIAAVAADRSRAETESVDGSGGDGSPDVAAQVAALPWPDVERWEATLAASPLVHVIDDDRSPDGAAPLDERPLVLRGTLLSTQRQWVDERTVAAGLRTLAGTGRLSVIVGGPGTGKTYTAAERIAGVEAGDAGDRATAIGLAAPTGKAAARLTAAIVEHSPGTELQAVTLHRLLGPRPDHRTRFRHDAANPLPHRLVVVDETSMVPLPLMARLVEAIPDDASLVLVGDPDQLESIEVGAVLGDVVRAAEAANSPLDGAVTRLTHRHRTAADSPIAAVADAIRDHDPDTAIGVLRDASADSARRDSERPDARHHNSGRHDGAVRFVEIDDDPHVAADVVRSVVEPAYRAAFDAAGDGDAVGALVAIESSRILCAHRRGPFGVETWNRVAADWLVPDRHRREHPGRPLLAVRNDPRTGIVNGDTGVIVQRDGLLRAAFRRGGGVRFFAPGELDEPETAYAMTVHKTQGSEYDTVVLVHPPVGSPLVGRELLYTAVTRAKRDLVIVGSEESLRAAITTPARRITGLAALLSRAGRRSPA